MEQTQPNQLQNLEKRTEMDPDGKQSDGWLLPVCLVLRAQETSPDDK